MAGPFTKTVPTITINPKIKKLAKCRIFSPDKSLLTQEAPFHYFA